MALKTKNYTISNGSWEQCRDKVRQLFQQLSTLDLPLMETSGGGVIDRDSDPTSDTFGQLTLSYDADQFQEQPAGTINLQHFDMSGATMILDEPLEILSTTTPQLKLSYDGGNNATFAVSSVGDITLDAAANIIIGTDLETDRWLSNDTNTFIGAGVVGAGNLAHAAGNEGWYNTALGYKALYSNTTGGYNTAQGASTLYFNTEGNYNSAMGYKALEKNITGSSNSAMGYFALGNNTTGSYNNAQGIRALYSNTTGGYNTAQGSHALYSNTIGNYNTAQGRSALYSNTEGNYNSAIGYKALEKSIAGFSNSAMGYIALGENTANYNTAQGSSALRSNTTGSSNTAVGANALYANITGHNNAAQGAFALRYSTGDSNTAFGKTALYANTTGEYNIGVGVDANRFNQTGSNNTILGYQAGRGVANHNKSGNTFIGYQAGYNETGSNKLYIENSDSASPLIYGEFDNNFITINGDLNVIGISELGDGGTTNYAQFASDGELTLYGTARITESLWLASGGLKAPGGKPATFVEYGLTGVWQFTDEGVEANQQTVSGTLKIPLCMDISAASTFHIGWSADGISPGNCEWQLEYLWVSPNDATNAVAEETLTAISAASSTSNGFVFATFTGVNLPNATDKVMLWKITRLSAGGNDTIADTVEMRGAALTYTINKLGAAV